jgi:3-oxoacyl-[acyl-carrier protein] reductase
MGFLEERAGLGGKVALIAGGAGGLGRAIALDFARAGMQLTIGDRNQELLDATAGAIDEIGAPLAVRALDVRGRDELRGLYELNDEQFGRLDVVVNVVGGTFRGDFADSNARGWEALIATNFTWVLDSIHLAIPRLRTAASSRGGASIINITSIEAHRAAPGYAVYAAMKAGVTSLTRTLAVELAPDGIRVNAIAPDMVPTEGLALDTLSESATRTAIPMGRTGTGEDVAASALFLASDLSTYLTGTTLHPDGGAWASSGWFNWPGIGFRNVPPDPEAQT